MEETVQVAQLGVVQEGEQSECAGEGVVQGGEDGGGGGGKEGLSHTEHNSEDTDVMTASPIFLISCPRWEMMLVCTHCQHLFLGCDLRKEVSDFFFFFRCKQI